jgi:hypothetical protein
MTTNLPAMLLFLSSQLGLCYVWKVTVNSKLLAHSCASWVASQGKDSCISGRKSLQRRLKNMVYMTLKTARKSKKGKLGRSREGEQDRSLHIG